MATGGSSMENKLVQLKLVVARTKKILESGNQEAIERQRLAKMINEKRDLEEISQWNSDIETNLAEADNNIRSLREWCESKKSEYEEKQRKQELDFELELFQTRMKFQNELQAAKLKQETTVATSLEKKASQAKLPKLIISKFNGTYQDWPRFWEQFKETIKKTSIDAVLKFAYLRELLEPKVRKSVEALPFTSEGYNRAKSILEDRYGKQSEIIKAYTKQIFDLPKIPDVNTKRIQEFADKLSYAVQSLETLGKLSQVNGYVSMTLDKLPGIRGDLVRSLGIRDLRESWDFVKLSEALRLWTRRNPVEKAPDRNSSKLLNVRRQDGCVYCNEKSHKSTECPKESSVPERRLILTRQHLCYNCTGSSHRANNCPSQSKCQKYGRRHHTSICDSENKGEVKGKKLLISCETNPEGIFPVVRIKVDGVECRALIDSGAGSSYASAKLINLLKKKPIEVAKKRVDMLMNSREVLLETYEADVEAVSGDFRMYVNLTKVNKEELLFVDNPCYEEVIKKYPHLEGVQVVEDDVKVHLPIHVVLISGDYARIKTNTPPRVGRDGEPIAEFTKLGWFIMSPGREFDQTKMFLTQTTRTDYEDLCRLDVLGLEDKPENDQGQVYSEFKEKLVRNDKGWYETSLPWRGNHLPTNEKGSISRLNSLVRKLERTELYNAYDQIIRDQLKEGVVEPASVKAENQEFYLPHRAVIREKSETTKLRVVYDGSARETPSAPSLNDCLNPGPPLQNKLWDVLTRQRGYPVAVSGDIEKAFLQVRIKAAERDALRFHWKHPGENQIQIYRFTRALFGLTCSPFLLGGVIDQHLEQWRDRRPEIVDELKKNLYVDDLLSGGNTVAEAGAKTLAMSEVLADGTFRLHKWNSNVKALGDGDKSNDECEPTFAKTQLGVEPNESKLLGLKWNKNEDTLSVVFLSEPPATTKRGMFSKLARVYDPLGLASPITVKGKMIYRDVCDSKAPWDAELSSERAQEWNLWEESIPELVTVLRSLAQFQEEINSVTLHAFGDASNKGVSAAVYSVVDQPSGTTQTLVTAKSRLAKRNLTIPRLELIGAHMAVNLLSNVRHALDRFLDVDQHCWLDSTVVLYWLQGNGRYKQFVQNRISKIHQRPNISWHYVPTKENPSDVGSRGANQLTDQWISGPSWLSNQEQWPENPVIEPSRESQTEEQIERVLSACAVQVSNDDDESPFNKLLNAHINNVWKTLRVCAWVNRFLLNCRKTKGERETGPLTTREIKHQELRWIKKTQQQALSTNIDQFQRDQVQLNLKMNEEVLECRGRIEGQYPIYLPDTAPHTKALVFQVGCCDIEKISNIDIEKQIPV